LVPEIRLLSLPFPLLSSVSEVAGSDAIPCESITWKSDEDLALLACGAVGDGKEEKEDSLMVSFLLLLCSASLSRNSFCFASNDCTPDDVTSDRDGMRHNGVVDANVLEILRETELFTSLRVSMVKVVL
jgi:hypothetical protein